MAMAARYLVTDAYRPASWMSCHIKVAGEPKLLAVCPNCEEEDEDVSHILWRCKRWNECRTEGVERLLHTLPEFVQRTLIPVATLTAAQCKDLQAMFWQAVRILDMHTKQGRSCVVRVRHRVVGGHSLNEISQTVLGLLAVMI